MRKARSRNFILFICGVFIVFLVVFNMSNFISAFEETDKPEKKKYFLEATSSDVKISGKGNFFGSTPKIVKSSIVDYGVLLKSPGDSVSYTVKFCNNNSVKLKYKDVIIENKLCTNKVGIKGCDVVKFEKFVAIEGKQLINEESILPKECIDLNLVSTFNSDVSEDIYISVDNITLEVESY